MHVILQALMAAALVSLASAAAAQNNQGAPDVGDATAAWRNPKLTPDQRARDLLPRLTLEEKISLLHGDGTFSTAPLTRFSIPSRWMSDGPNGVREEIQTQGWNPAGRSDDFATAMPSNVGLAASFDIELAKAYGHVIGEEARARNKHIMLGPGFNIMRTPLNGRNSEYFGEDPFLASRMAVNYIQAVQSHGVASCAKHFALNNQETQRNSINVEVDDRALREIYLPAFKASVTEAKVWTIMTAYNKVRGDWCSESDLLLNQILKKDWAFQGLVMSDWGGVHSTAKAANNGMDLEMGSNVNAQPARGASPNSNPHDRDYLAAPLLELLRTANSPVSMDRIDDMALRNLRVMAATGLLDPAPASAPARDPRTALMSPEHIATARRIAEASCVLLKNNNNLLPFDPATVKSIAVIGDNANTRFAHDGNSAAIKTRNEVTPLEGIKNRLGTDVSVVYAQGYTRQNPAARGRRGALPASAPATATGPSPLVEQAVSAARNADVAVIVAGLYRGQDQEGADRPNYNLPPGQLELIQAVLAVNPRTVVVLNGGAPISLEPWVANANALLMYWYGGTEGGNALARVLFGDANPSAKLPASWPKRLTDSPAHTSGPTSFPGQGGQQRYEESILVGYRWFDAKEIEPQFPFGFGLSYTTFELSNLRLVEAPVNVSKWTPAIMMMQIEVTVANTGPRDGAEVVQVYVQDVQSSLPRPPRELKGFAKVHLARGQRSTVRIPLNLGAFTYYDPEKKAWVAEAGEFTILAGTSSRDLRLKTEYKLAETRVMKDSD